MIMKIPLKEYDHIPCVNGYKLVCIYNDSYSKPVATYRGPNAVYKFIEEVLKQPVMVFILMIIWIPSICLIKPNYLQ